VARGGQAQACTSHHRLDVALALETDVPRLEAAEERVSQLRRRRVPAGVADDNGAAGREHARHLVDRALWLGEVVQRGGTDERREIAVGEGEGVARSEAELDVREAARAGALKQAGARDLQHAVGQVEPDRSLHAMGDLADQRAGPTRDVEHAVGGSGPELGERLLLE
jgi:hypothetical protein